MGPLPIRAQRWLDLIERRPRHSGRERVLCRQSRLWAVLAHGLRRPGVWVLTLLPGLRHDYPSLRTTQGIQMAVGSAAVGTRTPSGGLRSVSPLTR